MNYMSELMHKEKKNRYILQREHYMRDYDPRSVNFID